MTDRQLSELDVSELDLVVRRCDQILQLLAGLRAQLGDHQASEARRRARRRAVVEKKPAPVVVRISGIGAAARFLRERGAIVWQFDDGRYAVNGREVQPMHILKMANAKRVRAGMPLFELEYSA